MSLIALQQILQRLDRPVEIAARLSVLKGLTLTESKNAIKLCAPLFNDLPIDVGTHIWAVIHPNHQPQFVNEWAKCIFTIGFTAHSEDIVQKIFKVGTVVKHTEVELSAQLESKVFKALSSFCADSQTIDAIYKMLPSVIENYIAYNISDLKNISHQMHPNMNRVNRRVHNIVSSFHFANSEKIQEIDHLLNWTGFSTLASKNLDELRALMQNLKLHKDVEGVAVALNKRKM